MDKIKIVTDSASDLDLKEAEEYGIEVVPMSVSHRSVTYRHGIDINQETFSKMLTDGRDFPLVEHPSIHQFSKAYQPLVDDGYEVISIHVSEGIIQTVNNARVAARPFDKIHVVDSGFASYALALLVLEAAALAKKGSTVEQIIEHIQKVKQGIELVFAPVSQKYFTLDPDAGIVSSLVRNLLNIRPVIRIDNGQYVVIQTVRSVGRSLGVIEQYFKEKFGNQKVKVAVGHGQNPDRAKRLKEMLSQSLHVSGEVKTFDAGPMVGVTMGPGTVGAVVYPEP